MPIQNKTIEQIAGDYLVDFHTMLATAEKKGVFNLFDEYLRETAEVIEMHLVAQDLIHERIFTCDPKTNMDMLQQVHRRLILEEVGTHVTSFSEALWERGMAIEALLHANAVQDVPHHFTVPRDGLWNHPAL